MGGHPEQDHLVVTTCHRGHLVETILPLTQDDGKKIDSFRSDDQFLEVGVSNDGKPTQTAAMFLAENVVALNMCDCKSER